MDEKRLKKTKDKKNIWDSCSTAHMSLSGKHLVVLNAIGRDNNMSQSKVAQFLFLESQTFTDMLEKITNDGLFDETDSKYDAFRKKQALLK